MRKFRLIGIALAMSSASLAFVMPAGATAVGAGVIDGKVTITSAGGIPVLNAPQQPTTYSFSSTTIDGAITDTVMKYAGSINVHATGSCPAENTNACGAGLPGQTGVIDATSSAAQGIGVCTGSAAGCATFASVSGCALGGTFARSGPVVLVKANIDCLDGQGAQGYTAAALFIPTTGDGVQNPVTAAAFAGVFE